MARTVDKDARIFEQCGRGRRTRYIYHVPIIIANARTNMVDPNHLLATVISNSTANIGIFIAPCAGEVVRCYANAAAFADMAAGGTTTAKMTKAVIGDTDVDLCTAFNVGAAVVPTAETTVDGTLSTTSGALDLVEGQLVYAVILASNHAIDVRSDALVLAVEFIPKD